MAPARELEDRQEDAHPARVLLLGGGAEVFAMRCPKGGPRKAYCRVCLARAPSRRLACLRRKARL
eukprot:11161538-Lingulodinium_polyedra.AAC.1